MHTKHWKAIIQWHQYKKQKTKIHESKQTHQYNQRELTSKKGRTDTYVKNFENKT